MKQLPAAKTTPADLKSKIEAMMAEIKALQAENDKLKSKLAKESLGDVMDQVKEIHGVKVLAAQGQRRRYERSAQPGRPVKGKAGRRRDCSCFCTGR